MSIWCSDEEVPAWVYQGSHVRPARATHQRDAAVEFAHIPHHISKRRTWLRLTVDDGCGGWTTVLLDRRGARELRSQLTEWLDGTVDLA